MEMAEFKKYLQDRKKAYLESDLPYSFKYKIINAFVGKKCPICNNEMGYYSNDEALGIIQCRTTIPTIQHNKPLSLGGKHSLENISVICLSCNNSIRNKETGNLNNEEVIKEWNRICQM